MPALLSPLQPESNWQQTGCSNDIHPSSIVWHNCTIIVGVFASCVRAGSGGVGVKKRPPWYVLQVGVEGDMLKVWMLTMSMLLVVYLLLLAIINTYLLTSWFYSLSLEDRDRVIHLGLAWGWTTTTNKVLLIMNKDAPSSLLRRLCWHRSTDLHRRFRRPG